MGFFSKGIRQIKFLRLKGAIYKQIFNKKIRIYCHSQQDILIGSYKCRQCRGFVQMNEDKKGIYCNYDKPKSVSTWEFKY